MKNVNIYSVVSAYKTLEFTFFQKFMSNYGVLVGDKKGVRDYELDCIELLMQNIIKVNNDMSILGHYYLGYSIPQIGKEFDLLRFGETEIINIEVKTVSEIEDIHKQQEKNKYYLSFLGKEMHIYTYVKESDKLYKLMIDGNEVKTVEVHFAELCEKLSKQNIVDVGHIDMQFNPSNFLVSPFNATDKFLQNQYFLTTQQNEICRKIKTLLDDDVTNFIALTGGAGTGKTLLTYHIAREAISDGLKVLILHCAPLNAGHRILNENWGWYIYKPLQKSDISVFDIVIVDEAQRMYPHQLELLIKNVNENNKKCIFSYDEKQYLKNDEKSYNNKDNIENILNCTPFKLTNKIRTNKEIAFFIKQLFDEKCNIPNIQYPNIELLYSPNPDATRVMTNYLSELGWKTPNYTPSKLTYFSYERYASGDTDCAHSIIGQEFDRVVVVLDSHFNYDVDGNLVANNRYYSQSQMLYQIITRTRKKLCIIIMDNPLLLDRCLNILNRA